MHWSQKHYCNNDWYLPCSILKKSCAQETHSSEMRDLCLMKWLIKICCIFGTKKKPCSIFHYPKNGNSRSVSTSTNFIFLKRKMALLSFILGILFFPFILTKCPIRMQSAFFRTWFDSSLVLRTFHFTPTNIQIFLSLGGKWHCVIIGVKLIKVARVGIVL